MREALRDMLVFHTAALDDPRERVAQARALLRFLLEGAPEQPALGAASAATPSGCSPTATRPCSTTSCRGQRRRLLPRVRRPRRAPRAAVPRRGGLLEMQIGAASEPAARRYSDRRPGPPRAVPRLPQGADVPPDAARAGPSSAIDRTPRPEVLARLAVATRRRRAASPAPTAPRPSRAHGLDPDHRPSARRRGAAAGGRRWPAAPWVRDLLGPRRARPTGPRCATRCCAAMPPTWSRSTCTRRGSTTTPGEAPRTTRSRATRPAAAPW